MSQGLTKSEKLVASFSERAFLKLWTHPNPKGKKDKELCDCLIVCGKHIVIISVKDIQYKDTGNFAEEGRWVKSAIKKSVDQIYGAERCLKNVNTVTRSDGIVVELLSKEDRIVHRISVSLGAKRQISTISGDFGKGFVHVLDEFSLGAIFGLLDTITDFVNFLSDVESLISNTSIVFDGRGIEDLLAIYLQGYYSFEILPDIQPLIISSKFYDDFLKTKIFKEMQERYKESYFWDKLIEHLVKDLLTDGMIDFSTGEVTINQLALVQMALQPRRVRVDLVKSFKEFLKNPELKIIYVRGYHKTIFVILIGSSANRESRVEELDLSCRNAPNKFTDYDIVVGIARDSFGPSDVGYSYDLAYIGVVK